jgi:serine/threonine protein kinase
MTNTDSTLSAPKAPRRQLVDVLERYLADLEGADMEGGVAPDPQALLAQHPDLADELRPYLDSLRMLHGATRDMKVTKVTTDSGRGDPLSSGARQIGDFRIVREIGRGGMGIVYEALQKSLNRQVALKILPFAAVLDQRQIARFRNEAQAAAQLHHAHIVPVYAVGHEQGVYYYAMQYIGGQSLDQAITELRLPTLHGAERSTKVAGTLNGSTTTLHGEIARRWSSQRGGRHEDFYRTVARLGQEAADALQYAHEHGIVHRDVKPSNLLLDEQGKLWVTDFGLARMQSDSGVTLTGDVVGTLRYMSPEQATGGTLVDARTDVYSLGVTLYELLTRQHPHLGEDRQSLLRQIVDEEPIPPRHIDPSIPADLETIVLSAMAKSRDERYASARELAQDLERYLTGQPTLARRPTLMDRTSKWARRHRSLVAMAAAAMVVLSVVSVTALVLVLREQARTAAALLEARQNAKTSEENFARAERHLQQARGAVDQFGMHMADRLLDLPGAEAVRRDMLVEALGYYRQFAITAGDDPELWQETALAHVKSGTLAAKLGATADAIAEYQSAEELLVKRTASEPNSAEVWAQLARTHNNLGLLFASQGQAELARKQYDSAVEIQQRLVKEYAGDAAYSGQLAESEANLGMLLDQLDNTADAEKSLTAAMEVLRSVAASRPDEPQYARNLAITCNNLSYVLRKRDPVAADEASREAIGILETLAEQKAGSTEYQDDLALCYNNLAALKSQQQQWDDAIGWHLRAISLQEQMTRKSPAVVRYRSDLAISLNNVGVAYSRADRPQDADAAFGRARELLGTLAKDYPDQLAYGSSLAALLNNQALALAGAGRHEDALQLYPQAIQAQRQCWDRLRDSAAMRELLSKMYYNYGQSLRSTSQMSEAAETALSRRKVWRGNGDRLFGVAVELAEIASAWPDNSTSSSTDETRQKLSEEIVTTLRTARECGWPGDVNLASDERFAFLQHDQRFMQFVAEVNQGAASAASQAPEDDRASSAIKN